MHRRGVEKEPVSRLSVAAKALAVIGQRHHGRRVVPAAIPQRLEKRPDHAVSFDHAHIVRALDLVVDLLVRRQAGFIEVEKQEELGRRLAVEPMPDGDE
jgi:hypothetical protein